MNSAAQPLRIEIVSDIMCPWCVIGYLQLTQALTATQTAHQIYWLPFELNPNMPPEGQNMQQYLAEKYSISIQESIENRAKIAHVGAELGFEFNFNDEMRVYNTFNAHQLLHWAQQHELANDLKQALFTAHFIHNLNISDTQVLLKLVKDVGLDPEAARICLEEQRYASSVREKQNSLREQGVQSVPAIIFNQQHLISGAQGVENFIRILQQLEQMPG